MKKKKKWLLLKKNKCYVMILKPFPGQVNVTLDIHFFPAWFLYSLYPFLAAKWMTVSLQNGITCQTLNY